MAKMIKCSRCKKKKAKRYCIALGESLCSLCCGLLREKEIHCPPQCLYLAKHKSYQEKRTITKKQTSLSTPSSFEEDILNDERMAWLVYSIEMPLKEFGEKNDSFTDKDAILALEYAREKIAKHKGLLLMPDEWIKPQNDIGESVYQNIEKCQYEQRIILSGSPQTYKKEEKINCLDRVILSIKYYAKENYEGRNYIQRLLERFEKIDELSRQKKVFTIT